LAQGHPGNDGALAGLPAGQQENLLFATVQERGLPWIRRVSDVGKDAGRVRQVAIGRRWLTP
jgi:hypothetical protein